MAEKLPGCCVHATTVIDCRIKTLKRTFQAIAEMRGLACSDFGWNDEEKCIISHPVAKELLNKSFLYYDKLTYVFGRDRTTGRFAKTFTDVGSNEPDGYDEFNMGMETGRTMYAHHDLLTLQRVGPNRVDPRGRKEVSERWMLKAYIWRSTKQTATQDDCGVTYTHPCQ
uniref:Retrotransposon protein n=1 Tax=Cucumis melo TaxID=3656 RepID=A0A9I9ECN9_CUCME